MIFHFVVDTQYRGTPVLPPPMNLAPPAGSIVFMTAREVSGYGVSIHAFRYLQLSFSQVALDDTDHVLH